MTHNRRSFVKAVGGLALGAAAPQAFAQAASQEYPNKPIRLVVGYPPGGANDILARQIATPLSEVLGVPVLIDNRAGANGVIGAEAVAKSAPDGYTLLASGLTALVLNRLTYAKLPYNPLTDFVGISTIASSPMIIAVRPSLNVNTLTDLIRLAKARPGVLNFATVGTGGSTRIVLELLKMSAGVDIKYVPYKGAAPAITDIIGGTVDGMSVDFPALYPFVKDGRLRGLAITSEGRNPLLPELRTVGEQGLNDMTCGNWYALLAPARTPRPVVEKLHAALSRIVTIPGVRDAMIGSGVEPKITALPDGLTNFMQSELNRWGKVIKAAGIVADS